MTLVIDASVAVRWFFQQPGTQAAREIAGRREELIAPELIQAETGSAVHKYARAGVITAEQALDIAPRIVRRIDRFAPLSDLAPQALHLALSLDHSIYDCFYLALAQSEAAALITADRKLAQAAHKLGGVETVLIIED